MEFYNYSIKIMGRKINIDKVFAKNKTDAKIKAKRNLLSAIKTSGIILD